MFRLNSAAIIAAAGFGFVNSALADGLTPTGLQEALAKSKQSGKPLLAIAGRES